MVGRRQRDQSSDGHVRETAPLEAFMSIRDQLQRGPLGFGAAPLGDMFRAIPASLIVVFATAFAPAPLQRREPRGVFVERFTEPAEDVTKGYRSFGYETTLRGCKADVS